MVRVAVDTNVFVSALVGRGKPRRLVLRLLGEHSVVLSRQMLAELVGVLSREKFKGVKDSQVDRFLSSLVKKSKVVKVKSRFKVIEEDPDDDAVLNAAYAGKAEFIVSGDEHLLALKEFKGIKIVTVNEMLEILEK